MYMQRSYIIETIIVLSPKLPVFGSTLDVFTSMRTTGTRNTISHGLKVVWLCLSIAYGVAGRCYKTDSDQTTFHHNGLTCDLCQPGTYMVTECTRTAKTRCEVIPYNHYMPYRNKCLLADIKAFWVCKDNCDGLDQVIRQDCTPTQERKCGCRNGTYALASGTHCVVYTCPPGMMVSIAHYRSRIRCRYCPDQSYSNIYNSRRSCRLRTDCRAIGKTLLWKGNHTHDALCGDSPSRPGIATNFPPNTRHKLRSSERDKHSTRSIGTKSDATASIMKTRPTSKALHDKQDENATKGKAVRVDGELIAQKIEYTPETDSGNYTESPKVSPIFINDISWTWMIIIGVVIILVGVIVLVVLCRLRKRYIRTEDSQGKIMPTESPEEQKFLPRRDVLCLSTPSAVRRRSSIRPIRRHSTFTLKEGVDGEKIIQAIVEHGNRDNWKEFLRCKPCPGLTDTDIADSEYKHRGELKEIIYQGMMQWKKQLDPDKDFPIKDILEALEKYDKASYNEITVTHCDVLPKTYEASILELME
ncbi:tumor necrosis factor receptor superfamily member 21-like [Ptychodera flava]|uniref:tumor necrosis factor receptor superfamily member 21-like n=1 Tax=Ptychodera flava TaxID=63121 RepID=UPI00396A10FF